ARSIGHQFPLQADFGRDTPGGAGLKAPGHFRHSLVWNRSEPARFRRSDPRPAERLRSLYAFAKLISVRAYAGAVGSCMKYTWMGRHDVASSRRAHALRSSSE